MDETKKIWHSKTQWVALLTAVAAFFPPVQTFIAANPETYAGILSAVFAALRLISKEKLVIK
jgi:hypothetical protein